MLTVPCAILWCDNVFKTTFHFGFYRLQWSAIDALLRSTSPRSRLWLSKKGLRIWRQGLVCWRQTFEWEETLVSSAKSWLIYIHNRPVAVPSVTPTPLETQNDCQWCFESSPPPCRQPAHEGHSSSGRRRLSDADLGFPSAASTPLTAHTLKLTELTNHPQTAISMLDTDDSPVQEPVSSAFSLPFTTSQYCPLSMSSFCLRLWNGKKRFTFTASCSPVSHAGSDSTRCDFKITCPWRKRENYLDSAGADGRPMADSFSVLLFKSLISLNIYQNWAGSVNYDWSRGKDALLNKLRQTLSDPVGQKFHLTIYI